MKIIILEHEPYQERKKKHYFIDEFLEKNIQIEYWSLNRMLSYTKNIPYLHQETEGFVKYFDNFSLFFEELSSLNPEEACFFVELGYNLSTKRIFEFFSKHSFKWFRLDYYLNPSLSMEKSISFKEQIFHLILDKIFYKKIFEKVVSVLFLDKRQAIPNILFYTGSEKKYLIKAKEYVSLDYFDVATFREKSEEEPFVKESYIVFLDIMLGYTHPDFLRIGKKNIIDGNEYFKMIRSIFNKFEKKYGIPVIIAAHPKAKYTNEFGERQVIQHKTAELVINAKIVLTHNSLSTIFGVLSYKPIFFIDFKKLFSKNFFIKRIQKSIYFIAEQLKTVVIDENYPIETLNNESIDKNAYNQYLELYYKKESNNHLSNFEIVERKVEELMNEH